MDYFSSHPTFGNPKKGIVWPRIRETGIYNAELLNEFLFEYDSYLSNYKSLEMKSMTLTNIGLACNNYFALSGMTRNTSHICWSFSINCLISHPINKFIDQSITIDPTTNELTD